MLTYKITPEEIHYFELIEFDFRGIVTVPVS